MIIAGVLGTILCLILLYVELRWIKQYFEQTALDKANIEIIRDVVDAIKEGRTAKENAFDTETRPSENDLHLDLFFGDAERGSASQAGAEEEKDRNVTRGGKNAVLECRPSFEAKARRVLSAEELEALREQRAKRESTEKIASNGEIMPLEGEYDGFKRRGVRDAQIEDLKIGSEQQKAILAMLEFEKQKTADKINRLSRRGFAGWVRLSFDMPKLNFWFKLYALYTLGSACAIIAGFSFMANGAVFWAGAFSPITVYQLAFWGTFLYYYTRSNRTGRGGKSGGKTK